MEKELISPKLYVRYYTSLGYPLGILPKMHALAHIAAFEQYYILISLDLPAFAADGIHIIGRDDASDDFAFTHFIYCQACRCRQIASVASSESRRFIYFREKAYAEVDALHYLI